MLRIGSCLLPPPSLPPLLLLKLWTGKGRADLGFDDRTPDRWHRYHRFRSEQRHILWCVRVMTKTDRICIYDKHVFTEIYNWYPHYFWNHKSCAWSCAFSQWYCRRRFVRCFVHCNIYQKRDFTLPGSQFHVITVAACGGSDHASTEASKNEV